MLLEVFSAKLSPALYLINPLISNSHDVYWDINILNTQRKV